MLIVSISGKSGYENHELDGDALLVLGKTAYESPPGDHASKAMEAVEMLWYNLMNAAKGNHPESDLPDRDIQAPMVVAVVITDAVGKSRRVAQHNFTNDAVAVLCASMLHLSGPRHPAEARGVVAGLWNRLTEIAKATSQGQPVEWRNRWASP